MTALFRRAAQLLTAGAAAWRHPADLQLDHGHVPYGAWEAELTAYARLRTGAPFKVRFGLSTHTGWADEVTLQRPGVAHGQALDDAFHHAELELEHALMHYRHGWRETALLWHCWCLPDEELTLPWPPWDQVPLSGHVVRTALGRALPELALPEVLAIASDRRRQAARWLAAAWEDGAHRPLELAQRPGLESRLTPVPSPAKPSVWQEVLVALARPELLAPAAKAPPAVEDAVGRLQQVDLERPGDQVRLVLDLVDALGSARVIPPIPEQRPAWLTPPWGRWRRGAAIVQALETLARTPESSEAIAIAGGLRTARQRSLLGGSSGMARTGGASADGSGTPASEQAVARGRTAAEEPPPESEWGLQRDPQVSSDSEEAAPSEGHGLAEGSGSDGAAGTGGGAGALGALHVIKPSPEDRAAYWQLRGALAPEIERLVARFQAAGDDYYANAPRRFRTRGRLDRTRLIPALKGRDTVFTQFVHVPEPEHALCLILDCSASMHAYAEPVREMAIVVEAAAALMGARVTAFTFGATWERMEPAAKGAPLVALGRELRPRGGTPFGPALGTAAAYLARQPYEQKRLWVFTDGRWSARDRAGAGWRAEHLRNAVVWVLGETAPQPPHPAMRVVAAPTLAALIDAAPHYFWRVPDAREAAALAR